MKTTSVIQIAMGVLLTVLIISDFMSPTSSVFGRARKRSINTEQQELVDRQLMGSSGNTAESLDGNYASHIYVAPPPTGDTAAGGSGSSSNGKQLGSKLGRKNRPSAKEKQELIDRVMKRGDADDPPTPEEVPVVVPTSSVAKKSKSQKRSVDEVDFAPPASSSTTDGPRIGELDLKKYREENGSPTPEWLKAYIAKGRDINWSRGDTRPSGQCSDNSHCTLKKGCLASSLGVCYKPDLNTTFDYQPDLKGGARIRPRGGFEKQELVCSWQPEKPSPLPKINIHDTSPEGIVNMFKHVTGSFFQNWYDWPARIVHLGKTMPKKGQQEGNEDGADEETPPSPEVDRVGRRAGRSNVLLAPAGAGRNFKMTASHQGPDLLFKFENLCIRPSGRLAGYKPQLKPYQGGSDTVPFLGKGWYAPYLRVIQNFLTTVDSLPAPPTWYVDRKLVIMPMASDFHVAHCLSKAGSMVWNVDSAFPRPPGQENSDTARDDVTLMYTQLFFPDLWCREKCTMQDLGYWPYTTLSTTTHFSTYDRGDDGYRAWKEKTASGRKFPEADFSKLKRILTDNPVCFKEAVVFQSCHINDCMNLKGYARSAWPMYGFRQPKTQEKVAKRFRACAAVEHLGRESAGPKESLSLVYSYRSHAKSLYNKVAVLGLLWDWLREISPKGRVYQGEMSHMSSPEMIGLYSSVDIIVSPYGSGHMYGFLCPPHSAGIEIHRMQMPAIVVHTGLNKNTITDYGSMWRAGGGYHIAISLGAWNGRAPGVRIAMPDAAMHRGLMSYVCLFDLAERFKKGELSHAQIIAQQHAQCEITQPIVAQLEETMYNDVGGVRLQRSIRLNLPELLAPFAQRLIGLYNAAGALAPKIRHLRDHANRGALLLMFHCPGNEKNQAEARAALQALIAAEVTVWKLHVVRHLTIRVMIDQPCLGINIGHAVAPHNIGLLADEGGTHDAGVFPAPPPTTTGKHIEGTKEDITTNVEETPPRGMEPQADNNAPSRARRGAGLNVGATHRNTNFVRQQPLGAARPVNRGGGGMGAATFAIVEAASLRRWPTMVGYLAGLGCGRERLHIVDGAYPKASGQPSPVLTDDQAGAEGADDTPVVSPRGVGGGDTQPAKKLPKSVGESVPPAPTGVNVVRNGNEREEEAMAPTPRRRRKSSASTEPPLAGDDLKETALAPAAAAQRNINSNKEKPLPPPRSKNSIPHTRVPGRPPPAGGRAISGPKIGIGNRAREPTDGGGKGDGGEEVAQL